MQLTHHADQRRIQRSLPLDVLSAIYTYGAAAHAGGAISLMLDRQSIALAAEDDRRKRAVLERYQGCYVIVADHDRVVTTARSRRRFRR